MGQNIREGLTVMAICDIFSEIRLSHVHACNCMWCPCIALHTPLTPSHLTAYLLVSGSELGEAIGQTFFCRCGISFDATFGLM